jgi:L-ascorbate metabolism protein UlaG (beta-lactamase superfamily)
MSPDDAIRAHEILGAETSIAIHYGTFQLGDDSVDTPKNRLREGCRGDSFLALANGQAVAI